MLPEIGHSALLLAMLLCVLNGVLPISVGLGGAGRWLGESRVLSIHFSSRRIVFAQFVLVSISILILGICFLSNDFTVAYVAQHSNTLLPVRYKLSAVWGGHEGSLLLWLWILSGWSCLLALNFQKIEIEKLSKVLAVLSLVSLGFISFIIFTSNPFDRLLPNFPLDGQDLNPLLQDFGLIVHPPMLYMGYVGFAIPFGFAVAGLIEGDYNKVWAGWARPWAKVAWAFLGIGIALGSWWAYYELGWGGWWFWDPVENASLMPWLAGAALLHSLLVCEKRDGFRIWTVLISIIAFSLSLLGTFLVRSGVLTSVHAFASDPSRGLFILVFLGLVVGCSLALFSLRAGRLQTVSRFGFFSKEFFLILNNVFLLVACSTVLLGTLFPIVSDVMDLGKISVGPPYFNTLFYPMTLLLLLFFVLAPQLAWRETKLEALLKKDLALLILSAVLASAYILLLAESWDWKVFSILILVLWAFSILIVRFNVFGSARVIGLWNNLGSSEKNMHIAHAGFLVSLFGIAMTSTYSHERDVSLGVNESIEISGYEFTFKGVEKVRGPNYISTMGMVVVENDVGSGFILRPEKRSYFTQQKPMTEAAIEPGLVRDIYVALGEDLGAGKWSLRIYYKPFIRLVWLGAIIMSLSCLYYVWRRVPVSRREPERG